MASRPSWVSAARCSRSPRVSRSPSTARRASSYSRSTHGSMLRRKKVDRQGAEIVGFESVEQQTEGPLLDREGEEGAHKRLLDEGERRIGVQRGRGGVDQRHIL